MDRDSERGQNHKEVTRPYSLRLEAMKVRLEGLEELGLYPGGSGDRGKALIREVTSSHLCFGNYSLASRRRTV